MIKIAGDMLSGRRLQQVRWSLLKVALETSVRIVCTLLWELEDHCVGVIRKASAGGVDWGRMSVQRSLWKTWWTLSVLLLDLWTPTWPLRGLSSPKNRLLDMNLSVSNHHFMLILSECDYFICYELAREAYNRIFIRIKRMSYTRHCFTFFQLFLTNILQSPCRCVGNRLEVADTIRK